MATTQHDPFSVDHVSALSAIPSNLTDRIDTYPGTIYDDEWGDYGADLCAIGRARLLRREQQEARVTALSARAGIARKRGNRASTTDPCLCGVSTGCACGVHQSADAMRRAAWQAAFVQRAIALVGVRQRWLSTLAGWIDARSAPRKSPPIALTWPRWGLSWHD